MHHRDAPRGLRQAACLLDAQGHFLNVSPSLAAFFRCEGHTLEGQSLLARLDQGAADQVAPLLRAIGETGLRTFQVRLQGPGGAQWVSLSLLPGGSGPEGPLVVACFDDWPR